jgi:hypothetical protein
MDQDFLPRRGQNSSGLRSRLRTQNSNNWERPVAFRPPEEVAKQEELQPTDIDAYKAIANAIPASTGKPPRKSFKEWLRTRTKKQWIIIILIALLVLGAIGFGAYQLWFKKDPKPVTKAVIKQAPAPEPPKPIYSTLSGLEIKDPAINQRPVTAVMIENSLDARPQSGLNQAGVVFEAIAEGGITRFLTLFQDSEPEYIGPVRSVRPYYVQWAAGFDSAIAHVGGSADALRMLRQENVAKDLDQFFNPGPYRRVSNRFAPHNMYSSVVALRELQTQKGFTSNYKGFVRKIEAKSAAPNATSIDFNISGAVYNPHYDYDAATNSYKRSEGGKPHTDEKSGQQLSPKVVVALVMPQGRNGIYTTYNTIGSGEAFVFQDGILAKGTWHKTANKEQFTFTDQGGGELKLNPGQTWISVVGGADRVTFK